MTLYSKRDPSSLEPLYSAHVAAMTAEGLHQKSDIAAELAWRDARIEQLTVSCVALQESRDALALRTVELEMKFFAEHDTAPLLGKKKTSKEGGP